MLHCYCTCVSKFSKDIDENICICSTPFHIRSENTHYIFIIWKIRATYFKAQFSKQTTPNFKIGKYVNMYEKKMKMVLWLLIISNFDWV